LQNHSAANPPPSPVEINEPITDLELIPYRNWDQVEFRREWAMNPSAIIPPAGGKEPALVVLDEIHKDRRWKRNMKGVFDTLTAPCDILVTGRHGCPWRSNWRIRNHRRTGRGSPNA